MRLNSNGVRAGFRQALEAALGERGIFLELDRVHVRLLRYRPCARRASPTMTSGELTTAVAPAILI